MTDYDRYISLTKQIADILSKARIRQLQLELKNVLKEIESKCETLSIRKGGEDWYND